LPIYKSRGETRISRHAEGLISFISHATSSPSAEAAIGTRQQRQRSCPRIYSTKSPLNVECSEYQISSYLPAVRTRQKSILGAESATANAPRNKSLTRANCTVSNEIEREKLIQSSMHANMNYTAVLQTKPKNVRLRAFPVRLRTNLRTWMSAK